MFSDNQGFWRHRNTRFSFDHPVQEIESFAQEASPVAQKPMLQSEKTILVMAWMKNRCEVGVIQVSGALSRLLQIKPLACWVP